MSRSFSSDRCRFQPSHSWEARDKDLIGRFTKPTLQIRGGVVSAELLLMQNVIDVAQAESSFRHAI